MRYQPTLNPALTDLSFTIDATERVAVVGRTGAGKSSLLQLLLGFRQADKGRVLLDGEDISSLDLTYFRN